MKENDNTYVTEKVVNINSQKNKHNNNNNKIVKNDVQNNQHQLEILACEETLQDFEKYLLERGFNEMIECVVSKNKNERQNFSYFFKYFGFIKTDINSQDTAESNILFILNLKQILTTLKEEQYNDKKQQLLAIIAVALQNCKLRERFYPEDYRYKDEKIGNNLLSLLSQAQYFLRLAKKCKVSFSSRNVRSGNFLQTGYKEIDVIDSNNFLYARPHMMPLVPPKEIEDEIKEILIQQQQTQLNSLQQSYNGQMEEINKQLNKNLEVRQKTILQNQRLKLQNDLKTAQKQTSDDIRQIKTQNIDKATFNIHRNRAIDNIVKRNDRFVNKHFEKISTTILDFANKKSHDKKTEIIVPTSSYWGTGQNSFIANQYIQNIDKKNNNNVSLTINTSMKHLLQISDNEDIAKNKHISVYDKNYNQLSDIKGKNTVFFNPLKTFPDNAIYINSGDHLVFPSNEGYEYLRNKSDADNNTKVNYTSTDVAMINTEFFKFLGADGQLTNGIFTFNNTKDAKQNFQSLNMPNIFTFKDKNINATKLVTELCKSYISINNKLLKEQASTLCETKFPKPTEPKLHWYDPRSWFSSCTNGANNSLEQESKNTLISHK